ncbi:universal stress protein [Rhizobium sp. CNPSo 3968]|uniref:universal stress protein n=1 Tax=Rhizobium sp. CNPSo 3968 TaxID=3021408 RepID=UPI00254C3DF6|nr:universal stress protein [Rhizobium sp. CNPSo 3968]MDK4718833.1 universal stress protein [Rhizobium sp. CNPSo 3968]
MPRQGSALGAIPPAPAIGCSGQLRWLDLFADFDEGQGVTAVAIRSWWAINGFLPEPKRKRLMTFRSILVHFDIEARPERRIAFALQLAGRFDAELKCACFADPTFALAMGRSAALAVNIMRKDAAAIETRQRDLHEQIMENAPFSTHVEWCAEITDPTTTIVKRARGADLVVLFRLDKGQVDDHQRTADQGVVLLSAARPVLIPSPTMNDLVARTIVVAWKDTGQARRAITDALPLLRQAEDVVLLTVRETDHDNDTAEDVVHYLIRHNVRARGLIEPPRLGGSGEAIIDIAAKLQADLVVAGGYGHSRIRERIFGGVTEHLLRHCTQHLFLSN